MFFEELSDEVKQKVYAEYCAAMDDDLNRDNILSIEEYGLESIYEDLTFDADGNVLCI